MRPCPLCVVGEVGEANVILLETPVLIVNGSPELLEWLGSGLASRPSCKTFLKETIRAGVESGA